MRVVGYGAWMFTEPAVLEGRKKEERTKDSAKTWGNFHQDTAALLNLHGDTLLRVAMAAIDHGLAQGKPPVITARDYPDALQLPGASFVTLMSGGRLRGCVGSAEARRPLVEDVASNAYAAAFRDGRFPGLTAAERAAVHLAVSVLSPLEPMDFTDEGDLLNQLRPAQDGLVIADADARALFLPQVWSELKDPRTFLAQLKSKAGLSSDHWSPGMKAWRFVVETISSDSTPNRRTLGH
jgi:AmmeMemoRadiSam system protein A